LIYYVRAYVTWASALVGENIYIDNSASSCMLRNQTSANRTYRTLGFDVIQTQIRHEGYKSQDTIALLTPTTSLYKRLVEGGRDIAEIPTGYADRLPQVATPQPWSLLPLVSIEYTLCNPPSQLTPNSQGINLLNKHAAKTSDSC
jgi:hypothetical protein